MNARRPGSVTAHQVKAQEKARLCRRVLQLWLILFTGLFSALALAAPQIDVEGLMPGAAILLIDGERKMLREGQSYKGVVLVAAYSRTATLEVEGRQLVLGLSQKVGTNYQPPSARVVTINRNDRLQYQTAATINGKRVQVLVDTGANMVALNQREAVRLGIDLQQATPARVETASGVSAAWSVNLRFVDVGGIRVDNVPATVVEGDFPAMVLLGMTFLRHVKIKENQGIMTLSRVQ